ncbi:hypothetical protein HS088_TW09G00877 [Tripterygium wilfordii]|uniref:Uncharacterized protein n=1 Tax=Tripterygium wilfordii TaxID=458696 RepID=A0A7J7D8Z3_TRIWF|nr:hypothetical protein HS088_TW09G00877 [Tripterygium wilfordii]
MNIMPNVVELQHEGNDVADIEGHWRKEEENLRRMITKMLVALSMVPGLKDHNSGAISLVPGCEDQNSGEKATQKEETDPFISCLHGRRERERGDKKGMKGVSLCLWLSRLA